MATNCFTLEFASRTGEGVPGCKTRMRLLPRPNLVTKIGFTEIVALGNGGYGTAVTQDPFVRMFEP
jgi:hypothetical protein